MFGVSFFELILIFVVILVLFGPDKLPEAARALGRLMGELKRNSDSVRREFYNAVYIPANEIRSSVLEGKPSKESEKDGGSNSGENPAVSPHEPIPPRVKDE